MYKSSEEHAKNLRKSVLDLALKSNGEAHIGGSFSEIEILVTLFDKILQKPDKFILSKGHCCFPYYILLQEKGYNPKIAGHPDLDPQNGIFATTGSLGHGFPMGLGMAFARKYQRKEGKIYVLMSDGECEEGTTWESSLLASKHKLDNLVLIIDKNELQALDRTDNILPLGNLSVKFRAFGFNTREIDGHSFVELNSAFDYCSQEKPYVVIAHTIKGKGVSYMENNPDWHGKRVTPERVRIAYEELE